GYSTRRERFGDGQARNHRHSPTKPCGRDEYPVWRIAILNKAGELASPVCIPTQRVATRETSLSPHRIEE
ncbi:MAG: hypothetical protein ACRERV_16005, partial [Methylococcales bacterium]